MEPSGVSGSVGVPPELEFPVDVPPDVPPVLSVEPPGFVPGVGTPDPKSGVVGGVTGSLGPLEPPTERLGADS